MNTQIIELIAQALSLSLKQVNKTIELLSEGATVPFIARYRKEVTGSLDEVQILKINELKDKYETLEKRKQTILKSIDEQQLLKPELKQKIEQCWDGNELEDIYLPFKPKRRTKAAIAREKGLEPMAKILMKQYEQYPESRARQFVGKNCKDEQEVLEGARDIIAEWVNENERTRSIVRNSFERRATIKSKVVKGKETEGIKYRDYFDWEEPLKRCASHRLLAMRRGEKEGILKISITPDAEMVLERMNRFWVKGRTASSQEVEKAVKDAYKRLLQPSIETEFAKLSREKGEEEAIAVFAENLKQLLLAAPLGQKRVLAIDPGYRTGCKVVCLDELGNIIGNTTIFPHPPQQQKREAERSISDLVAKYKIEAIAIGNGTASRETEQLVKGMNIGSQVFVVSEDGASVYSASEVAREEFPEYDVTVRGAISIGRRLMDPLAELVKIDPKSIGVGQYQHDVDQKKLKESLNTVVELAVNNVGVNLNTASKHVLTHVSGLGPQLAGNIIQYRNENGAFQSRAELKKVARMGAKSFEQCAGFLRIAGGKMVLDNSAVHPEVYPLVQKMAKDLGCKLDELIGNEQLVSKINAQTYITEQFGLPTIKDILKELAKPGLDPREEIEAFSFAEGIYSIEDLYEGMTLPGVVNNITKFGAFVDIGIKQAGLVHVSEMTNRFINDPAEVVKLQQKVKVKVIGVDLSRNRIQLSIKQAGQ
ncbi:RNA-binding transcriptional accessory protein [Prolixibacteraceae bacterium JC049]|nr:RNA-binding transcriptional accessory protein [Prolixibacteraceae bacterium JC049]